VILLVCPAEGRQSEGLEYLSTDFERCHVGALWLGLIFACGGADENGWRNVGAAAVEGVGIDINGVAMAAAAAVGNRHNDDAGIDNIGSVGAVAIAVVSRIDVKDGGGVDTVVAVVIVEM